MRGETGVAVKKISRKKTIEDVKSVNKKINSKDITYYLSSYLYMPLCSVLLYCVFYLYYCL